MNNALTEPMMAIEPFEDRIDGLFRELELAVKWQRPSILFALFKSDHVRADVENAIMERLVELGQSVFHLRVSVGMTDIAESISEMRNIEQVVFFVDSLKDVAHKEKNNIYLALNNRRERFIDQRVRIIFWMDENEVSQLANTAPDFWAFRHRVIEFVDSPKPEQILLRTLETTLKDSSIENDEVSDNNEKTVAYANLLLTLGILHWRNHEYQKSLKSLQSAQEIAALLDDNVYESEVYNAIALVRSELGEIKEAITAYEKAIELAPDRIMAWNNLGILYDKLGDLERSVAAYCKAIEFKSSDVVAWNGLANSLFKLGQVDEAISAYQKALHYSPGYAKAWEGIGFIYASTGKDGEAIYAYKRALRINNELVDSWLGLGDVLSRQNRNHYALKAYERAISLEPDNAQALYALGNQYFVSDDYKRAVEAYSRALELGWESVKMYLNLATSHYNEGQFAEAAEWFHIALGLMNDSQEKAIYWNRLGEAYRHAGDYDSAMAAYQCADNLANALSTGSEDEENNFIDESVSEKVTEGFVPALIGASGLTQSGESSRSYEALSIVNRTKSDEAPQARQESVQGMAPEKRDHPELETTIADSVPSTLSFSEWEMQIQAIASRLDVVQAGLAGEVAQEGAPSISAPPDLASRELIEESPVGPISAQFAAEMKEISNKLVQIDDTFSKKSEPVQELVGQSSPLPENLLEAELFNEQGNAFLEQGLYDEAIAAYMRAIELAPDSVWAYIQNLAQANYQKGMNGILSDAEVSPEPDDEEERQALRDDFAGEFTQDNDSQSGVVSDGEASSSAMVKNDAILETSYDNPVNNDVLIETLQEDAEFELPENPETLLTHQEDLVEELVEDNNQKQVTKEEEQLSMTLARFVKGNPKTANDWNEIGNAYLLAGHYDEAMGAYNKAIELSPQYGWPYSNLALVYSHKRRYSEAVFLHKQCIRLLKSDSDKAIAWNRLGDVYRRLNDRENALEAYENAVELDGGANNSVSTRARFALLDNCSV